MNAKPVRVASIGIGWWSDVLADAVQRSGALEIVGCYTRSEEKRAAFAEKYRCEPAPSLEAILEDPAVEGVINTTPNNVHLETCAAAARAGKHIFVDKPRPGSSWPWVTSVAGNPTSAGCAMKSHRGISGGWSRRRRTSPGAGWGGST